MRCAVQCGRQSSVIKIDNDLVRASVSITAQNKATLFCTEHAGLNVIHKLEI